jgi:two-component system, chemotaxis family, protein-glutamate methylesterase/glutaminase
MTSYDMQTPYAITCPECGGALFPVTPQPTPHFRCHIGHKLSPEAMMESQLKRLEVTLAAVMVIIKERSELCRQLQGCDALNRQTAKVMIEEADKRANEVKALLELPWAHVPR